jgi:L-lactate utilization protein LutC
MSVTLDRQPATTTPEWAAVATEEQIATTAAALRDRGFAVQVVDDAAAAREAVLALIPEGAEVHQGSSTTLDEIGVTDVVTSSGRYDAVRPRMYAMDRATQAAEIRRLTSAPAYMLGSVHAVTEQGSLVAASKSGSQLGPYAYGAGKLILVAGTNKIVPNLDEAFRRINDHSLPLESARAQVAYGITSSVDKLLVTNAEIQPGRTTVILVRESLGY